jgi:hypothetical protein
MMQPHEHFIKGSKCLEEAEDKDSIRTDDRKALMVARAQAHFLAALVQLNGIAAYSTAYTDDKE